MEYGVWISSVIWFRPFSAVGSNNQEQQKAAARVIFLFLLLLSRRLVLGLCLLQPFQAQALDGSEFTLRDTPVAIVTDTFETSRLLAVWLF
ncbi:hypothetical protein GGR55DRAFT_367677 [Xylaria sp. FL0064]|nr:hypothetical protein GGR55DRAFT_367677 [Xylaria sp. FL0064]